MIHYKVLDWQQLQEKPEPIALSEAVFGQAYNEPLIHQIIVAYMAAARQGTHQQKRRSDVRGGGKKPWRQKGTGRARAGTTRSPIWRKGGVTFAARPQDYSVRVNKKMYRAAMRSILSELVRSERMVILDDFSLASHKTRELLAQLDKIDATHSLILLNEVDENIYLAARNIPDLDLCEAEIIDPVSLVRFPKILTTVAAVKQLEERLA